MLVHDLEYAKRRSASGPLTRLTARVRAVACDRALAAGADPGGSPQLAARAAHLTGRSTRARIAEGLDRILAFAQGPPRRFSAVSGRGPIPANAARLRELASLLRCDTVVYAQGVAMLRLLVTDGCGPAYRGTVVGLAHELDKAHSAATAGLDPSH